ncbi:hypothetical protein H2N64_18715 [Pseudomonas aeruginosa]|uniref:TOPRIM nucleotidyl transferase/hydrolase domain-containing protein n=1 Tax=Pseudomonas aeruginosa TaxID=287 RepID=UPI0015F0E6DB|nr:TOPRIM nucleotidyl transferase/hydrolase domain-containing protein [Pseudomonas aeruginosa]MBA5144054.1 hypothetical protein [Pseudomonas aeruginosa]
MATTMDEIHYDEMLQDRMGERVMEKAAMAQCIYIFVEGHSEERIFEGLLEGCGLDLKRLGVVVANYNGIGNLGSSIRLLRKTLSHDRPVIVTYDDDLSGKRQIKNIHKDGLSTFFKIPCESIVKYRDGSEGGSLEEAFTPELFVESSFACDVILNADQGWKAEFSAVFNKGEPWFPQLVRFVGGKGVKAGSINKIRLSERMAESCSPIPKTFKLLADLVIKLRRKYPVKNPYDIDL